VGRGGEVDAVGVKVRRCARRSKGGGGEVNAEGVNAVGVNTMGRGAEVHAEGDNAVGVKLNLTVGRGSKGSAEGAGTRSAVKVK
jgi:hypothetical protein